MKKSRFGQVSRLAAVCAATFGVLAIGVGEAAAQGCCGGGPPEGMGGIAGPGIIMPPIRPTGPIDFIDINPSRVFPDGGPGERPEMAPPINIGEILIDLGELAPSKYPPLVEMSERGSKKITYFDSDGNVVAVAYVFPDNELYAKDASYAEALWRRRAAAYGDMAERARYVQIGADIALVILGAPAGLSIGYAAAKAGGSSASTSYQEGKPVDEIALDAAVDAFIDGTTTLVFERAFAGAGKAPQNMASEAHAAREAAEATVRQGQRVLSRATTAGRGGGKAAAKRAANLARGGRGMIEAGRRRIAQSGRDLARARAVQLAVDVGKDAATRGGTSATRDILGR